MYGNEKSVGFTPYDKSQGFSPTPANKRMRNGIKISGRKLI
jgi:hypothetical protein